MKGQPSLYGAELRRARERRGLTQEALAEAMRFSQAYVGMIEVGCKPPSSSFTDRADDVLGLDGLLGRIREHDLRQTVTPVWLQDWVAAEQEATHIWWFELSLVPGLLQTEEYASEVLRGNTAKVAARMARQEALACDEPPAYVALLDERALRYPVGDAKVMAAQLDHLTRMADQVVIQVIPTGCGTYLHLDGSFGLARVDGREYAYADTPLRGFMLDDPEIVLRMRVRWDLIRAEALSRRQTIELIKEVTVQ